MKISLKWLKDYVDIDIKSNRQFSEDMTLSGSKVEEFDVPGDEISNVVFGKILSIEKHPDSDHLVVCQVNIGKDEPQQIVTGAANLKVGDVVPVALPGSTLPGGVKIEKGKLRGVESDGMLCSLGELGLTVHDFPYAIENGIFVVEEDGCVLGEDVKKALGLDDTTVDFEITPNRPDCLSVLGIAREAAATYSKEFNAPKVSYKTSADKTADMISVKVEDKETCPRYMVKVVKDVKIGPSPLWLRERLRGCGVRPINNIVDITNFVMLEYGQPMHAFDYKYVEDGQIIVRRANAGEIIETLEGVEHKLDESMLVIANSKAPMAVAGVMGGKISGINENTTTMVFESANFKGASVRNTSRKLGLRTDSSAKFEKGLDSQNCAGALDRACQLVEMLGCGTVTDGVIDVDNSNYKPNVIDLDVNWINKFLGTDISEEFMINVLKSLEFKVENGKITCPSFRGDVEGKADIAEEVARFYGYNKIPSTLLKFTRYGNLNAKQKFERRISNFLIGAGYSEIQTYSFMSPKCYDKINLPKDSSMRNSIVIKNPLGEDTSIMRTSTLPTTLEVLSSNYNNRNDSAKLFEFAKTYWPNEDEMKLPEERVVISIGSYGKDCDFFGLKGVIDELFRKVGIKEYEIKAVSDNTTYHPGRCAEISVDGKVVVTFGEAHPVVSENYDIGTRIYMAEIDFNNLFDSSNLEKVYKPLSKFPATSRDIAVTCDENIPVFELEKAIKLASGKNLESVELFDVYCGEQVEKGKKSVAFTMLFRSDNSTLTVEEIDKIFKKILFKLGELGAVLRS